MDSAQILHDENMQVTALGFYDVQAQNIVSTIHIPGVVQDITGSGNKAFVSSYYPPQVAIEDKLPEKKSNIYEVDLDTKAIRPIFKEDQKYVPLRIISGGPYIYGIFQGESADFLPKDAPKNILVKIDPKTGTLLNQVKLLPYAKDLVLSSDGRNIFVTHFEKLASATPISVPISRVSTETFDVKEVTGNFRACSIVSMNGKIYVGDELNQQLTVIDEQTLRIEKTIPVKLSAIYLSKTE
ncbi:hypothetical protein DNHGIG_11330 [Collibacillus ludicampi]|uniref:YncE family protein n=2 Tax=Collibacillus ludicampi TaxID=2771369 RepID=A0AAV4LCL7_9BACL|nr:hypothetical protein DNHGIG_11330 [Collibacillus ludicampi]